MSYEFLGYIFLIVNSRNLFVLLKLKSFFSRNSNNCLIWIFIFDTDQAQIYNVRQLGETSPLATNPAYSLFYPCLGKSLADTPFIVALCGTPLTTPLNDVLYSGPEAKFVNVQYRWGFCRPNLESSQTWGFCMDSLNHWEGGMVFYQVFLLSPLQCTVTEL